MTKAVYFKILEYTSDNLALLRQGLEVIELNSPRDLTDSVLKKVEVLFAPLGYHFDATLLGKCSRLKVIATNTTGVPHIDVEYAEAHGIQVISLKEERSFLASITPTAELAIGLIICVTRNVIPAVKAVEHGVWRRWDFGGPAMLSRMSLGIVGMGRLGRMVARYAISFGMKVSYYDPFVDTSEAGIACQRSQSLEQLVSDCDVVSLHVPMAPSNRHLFNAKVFGAFKKNAYFVNTARGEIVDSEALLCALCSGQLAGAALDVLDGEFEPGFDTRAKDHPLIRYARENSNLIITPHIAGSTKDAWRLTQRHTIEQAFTAVGVSFDK